MTNTDKAPFKNIFDILPNYRPSIGVMGSASGGVMRNAAAIEASREIGREIARRNCILINGACPGLPDEAARGANELGGHCIGISPAISIVSHLEQYKSPIEQYDQFIFTGMGLMMRDIINVRSGNGVIILPGGTGTLNEFTVAYDEGKPIGILTGYGGVADHIPEILEFCKREKTDKMVFGSDPVKLVQDLLLIIHAENTPDALDGHLVGENGEVSKIEKQFEKKKK
jgi:uncharacterized protein (TIGR00725 family)